MADEVMERLKRRMATLRVGDPLDKNTDVGAINSAEQLAKIRELSDIGEAEGAGRWSPPCDLPDHGFWFPPTVFTGVSQAHRIAREEIFGPVLSVLTFRTPAEAVEKANNTPFGLSAGIWTDKGSRILWMADQLRAGVVWANTFNKFDPTSPFGGYKESGYGREGGRHGLEAYLDRTERSVDAPRARRAQDLQAVRRRGVPPLRVRPLLRRARQQGQVPRERLAASRKDARDAVQAARKAFGGWSGRTPYNRGQVVYRIAEVLEGRRAQFVDEVQRSEGVTKRQAEAAVDAAVDRLVWYAGWADKIAQVVGGTNPVAAPYFNFSLPEPTGVVGVVAPQGSSLLGLVSVVAPVIVTGNTVVCRHLRRAPAARDHAVRGARHLRRARRRRQRAHRRGRRTRRRRWPRTWTSTPSTSPAWPATPTRAQPRDRGRREPQAGAARPRRRARLDRASPASTG